MEKGEGRMDSCFVKTNVNVRHPKAKGGFLHNKNPILVKEGNSLF
jgi:hypothetical protein